MVKWMSELPQRCTGKLNLFVIYHYLCRGYPFFWSLLITFLMVAANFFHWALVATSP